jgi:hypothetical protein
VRGRLRFIYNYKHSYTLFVIRAHTYAQSFKCDMTRNEACLELDGRLMDVFMDVVGSNELSEQEFFLRYFYRLSNTERM